jgi:3-oxoacyl-[acyl-carrier protein] reductase
MLDEKVAVIYGAGSIGSAVAKAFVAAGSQVYVASRTQAPLDALADAIRASGCTRRSWTPWTRHRCASMRTGWRPEAGRIDICFNLIGHGDVHGTPLIEMDVEDFVRPIDSILRSTFLTSQATARHMVGQRRGVILIFGGEGEPMRDYSLGGTLVAFHAQETMRRQLATELGPLGVRVVTIITGGIPETIGDDADPAIGQGIVDATIIGRAATYEDVGNVAVFAASDQARMMTAATLNISGGSVID